MLTKYVISFKDKAKTLKEWLVKNHLGKTNIYKLSELKAFSNETGVIDLDYNLKNHDIIYINYSLLEDNSNISDYKYDISILYSIYIRSFWIVSTYIWTFSCKIRICS